MAYWLGIWHEHSTATKRNARNQGFSCGRGLVFHKKWRAFMNIYNTIEHEKLVRGFMQ